MFVLFILSAAFETLGIGAIKPFLDVVIGDNGSGGQTSDYMSRFLGERDEESRLLIVGTIMIVIFLFRSFVMLLREYQAARFANLFREYWSARIFRNFLYGYMLGLKKQKQGHFINTMINEPIYAAKGLAALLEICVSVIVLFSILFFLLWMNWQVTLAAAGIVIIGAGSVWRVSKIYSKDVGKVRIQLNQNINQMVTEAVGGIRQIKVFSAESRALKDMKLKLGELMRKLNLFALVNGSPKAVGDFLVVGIIVSALFVGKFGLHQDLSSFLPEMGVFAISFMKLFSLASVVLAKRMEVATYWPSICLVHGFSVQEPQEKHDPNAKAVRFKQKLTAKNLTFSFSEGEKILDNVSFEITAGEIVGLAGRSGSGKSTICDLLAKLNSLSVGSIEVDNVDLSEIGLAQWRSRIGYVSQETFLFNTSIAENILIGVPSAPRQEAVEAARLADAEGFIMALPDGFDTVVGAGGAGLSGGQRQRIALARALARKPDLLILDEATSGLDVESEAIIFKMLRKISEQMTVIIVTHRLDTLRLTDRILFLEKGKIVEEGSFEKLYSIAGSFRKLVDSGAFEGANLS
ncbi:MAG: ABC transporter ATP-binding protein [Alphaproteobacteria bacterium]|nr:ABC transporter ATP-binding protein [Alphaproteobacteria bacterium]